jgi:hypothetical protein
MSVTRSLGRLPVCWTTGQALPDEGCDEGSLDRWPEGSPDGPELGAGDGDPETLGVQAASTLASTRMNQERRRVVVITAI